VAVQHETLDAGDAETPPDTSYPGALVRVGLLTELQRDSAALIPLAGPDGAAVDVVSFTRGEAAEVAFAGGVLTIACADPWMSSRHARLRLDAGGARIEDLGSRNGVLLGNRRVEAAALAHGDLFVLGRTAWVLHARPFARELVAASLRPFGPTRSVSPGLLAAVVVLERCAASELTILLQGDTGTGKEVLAREAHRRSGRSGPFIGLNCAALPEALLEGQLFGHRRGAFTGAVEAAPGLVLASSGGTLFLDEIADMPPAAQAKLLRVLEERAVVALGETAPRKVDLRVIAAGQRDLRAEVEQGRFRRDLFARLAQVVVTLPPLRERRGDLGLLAAHACAELGTTLALSAARVVMEHAWPMNVRELLSGLRAAAVMAGAGNGIEAQHLPEAWRGEATAASGGPGAGERAAAGGGDAGGDGGGTGGVGDGSGGGAVDDGGPTREALAALLARHQGNVTAAARELGKGKMQLYRWMSRRGMDPASFRRGA
jgi:DNA-binding NtrC family response regulator